MEIQELHKALVGAWSDRNLNYITSKLIELYKNKNYAAIREVVNKISKYVVIDEENDAKCFSRLVMLYHPDRGEAIRNELDQLFAGNHHEKLTEFSHILIISRFDFNSVKPVAIDEDIDYDPGYGIYESRRAYKSYTDEEDIYDLENSFSGDYENSFYNAVRLRMYGDPDREFPAHYLHDFEEFELSESGIETLDGVEHCIHAVSIDLSNNAISDLSELWELQRLEELYLANNQISYIDALSNLLNLRIVDLSGNQIDDITPLLSLDFLEYVNLAGNPVPKIQVEKLKEKEVMVMF
ncbi:MAG: hypothetical protein CVU05_14300 [Bacteroidetes bacterium HGW-Bacteroidetes-21]|jgi:Leucine-rich repeat (LRR) protein|nr:MAG: hypothetical protein CVU05_14300 [Bacteroidetes bacterium HGW-Bacteroidetes-21]